MFPFDWISHGGALVLLPLLLVAIDAAGGFRAGRVPPKRRLHARRIRRRWGPRRRCDAYDDFDVLVPIYGDVKYLENVAFLRRYGRRVLLCTTSGESAEFNQELERIARANGFRIFRGAVDRAASNGKRATGGTVRDRLVRDALGQVRAEYVVCIDADSSCPRPLDELVGEMVARELDMASVRLVPSNAATSWLTRLQAHEYRFAMHIRTVVPWLVSGACHVARTDVHREIMSRHSLFFQGNDVEIGILAKGLGYRVGHIRFDVATAVPETLKPWFRQRLAWAGGEVRLFIANPQIALRHPFFWFYGALLVIMASPLRWESVFQPGTSMLLVAISYCLLLLYFHFEHRDRYLFLFPFYGLFTSLVMVPLGVFAYSAMVLRDHNFGFIRLGRGAELRAAWEPRAARAQRERESSAA